MYSEIASNKRKTIFLMFGFLVFIGALAYGAGWYFNAFSITIIAIVVALFYAIWSYYGSDKLALTVNNAQKIQKADNPRLWRIVENLSITDGLPMPVVYIIDDRAPNAFATGRDPQHASVAVTSGLLDIMDDNELEGVLAHELGHVKNYDIRVAMVVFGLVAIVSLICDFIIRWLFIGGLRGRSSNNNNETNPIFFILAIVALILAPLIATIIQLAISRKREYLADATGALTTRYPEGLASALEKIKLNGSVMQKQNPSTAHLFFANPLKAHSFSNLFSTHPPIDDRIKVLREMEVKV